MNPRMLIQLAARLLPAAEREIWIEEWTSEFDALRSTGAGRWTLMKFARGSFAHAWSRRNRNSRRKRTRSMDHLLADLRFAARSFRRSPTFSAVALITLALGIGATASIFSVVNGVLIEPLPYESPRELVMIGSTSQRMPGLAPVSPANFKDWRRMSESFTDIVAHDSYLIDLVDGDQPQRVMGVAVSGGFFDLLGVRPELGRGIEMADDIATGERVVVISHRLWQTNYSGRDDIIGSSLRTADATYTIIGVMPQSYRHPESFWVNDVDAWIPLEFVDGMETRGGRFLQAMGRLAPGVTIEQARQEMDQIAAALREEYPVNRDRDILLSPLRTEVVGDVGSALVMLLAAVSLLLVIACVNVANLYMARATDRRHEVALRAALGASSGRIYRQLLTEGMVLSTMGGLLGLLLAYGAVGVFRGFNPADVPRVEAVTIDMQVLVFCMAISALVGLAFAIVPAWKATRVDLTNNLKSGGRGSVGTRPLVRQALVGIELALAIMLVVGAGLLMNSFVRLRAVDPGFETANLVAGAIALNSSYSEPEQQRAFFARAAEEVEALPGVVATTYATSIPFDGQRSITGFTVEGVPPDPSEPPIAEVVRVGPGYFTAMGVEILQGRDIAETDDASHELVVVVNETLARRHWPDRSPIGELVSYGRSNPAPARIIGVIGDVDRISLGQEAETVFYIPVQQSGIPFGQLVARFSGDADVIVPAMRARLGELDASLPLTFTTMEQTIRESIAQDEFYTLVLGAFATVALILAAVGVYGTMAYAVGARERELGIRMALGESGSSVLVGVMRQGALLVALGVGVGLAGAFVTSSLLETLLYSVDPRDFMTYSLAAAFLAGTGLLACLLPALRAGRTDPMVALRSE